MPLDVARVGIDAEELVQARSERDPDGCLEPARELIDPGAPHELELDERAVLVEDQQVDARERIGR